MLVTRHTVLIELNQIVNDHLALEDALLILDVQLLVVSVAVVVYQFYDDLI